MNTSLVLHNGRPSTDATLARMAFASFAHFTAMQVRGGAVRGVSEHLQRLRHASDELFGTHLPDATILDHLRTAVATNADASLTVFIAPAYDVRGVGPDDTLDTFVRVDAPARPSTTPVRLMPIEHERDLPHIKHVGEIRKTLALQHARDAGFDDALFVNRDGLVSEATIWNVVFWDGQRVIWPRAALLDGVTQQVVRRQLQRDGVDQRDLAVPVDALDPRWSAAILNSWTPGIGVAGIGQTELADPAPLTAQLHAAYDAAPPQSLHTT